MIPLVFFFFSVSSAKFITFEILTDLKLNAYEAEEICNRAGGTLPHFSGQEEYDNFLINFGEKFEQQWLGIDWLPREHYSNAGSKNNYCKFNIRNQRMASGLCEEKKNFICRFEQGSKYRSKSDCEAKRKRKFCQKVKKLFFLKFVEENFLFF